MLKRAFGVKGAVFVPLRHGAAFALIGVLLAASGARLVYSLALLSVSFIVVYSIKIARKKQIEEQIIESDARALSEQASTPAEPVPGPESATVS
jgi:hypothetical protein